MKKISYGLLTAVMIFSCTTQDEISPPNQNNSEEVLNYIKSFGIPEEDIQEFPDKYVVQEDIVFPKKMIVPESVSNDGGRTKQYYNSLVNFANQANIRIKIDPSMTNSPNMTAEINFAIDEWNSLLSIGSRIRLSIVTGSSYDIIIKNKNLGSGICGQGSFPSGGSSGATIDIHKSYIGGNSFDQRKRTIAHEIGHCIGFWHTNQSGGIAVPGQGGADVNSLMNAGQCGTGATVLSIKDKNATVVLYPTDAPYGFGNNGHYPWIFSWSAPLYTGFGSLLGYEAKHIRYDYQGNPHVSATTFQTTANYTLPFIQGQYPGQNAIVSVRAQYIDGSFSSWSTYNCTL